MSDTVRSISSDAPVRAPHQPGHAAPAARARPLQDADDPVTEWLLEQPRLEATEFAVLFAIHKFNARGRGSAWIRRTHLCRSSGLDQPTLTKVLTDLRHKGLVGMSRHPVDSSRARYLLIVG